MSEEWRRIQGFRGVSRLRVIVTSDAEIEVRSHAQSSIHGPIHLSAGEIFDFVPTLFPDSFSLWLKSDDPNCQCQIQAEYREDVTDLPLALDMRFLYGPIGLGIPITGNPLDYQIPIPAPALRSISPSIVDALRRDARAIEEAKQPKEEKPCPGVTRLQAFKRELEEEKPTKKEVRKKK